MMGGWGRGSWREGELKKKHGITKDEEDGVYEGDGRDKEEETKKQMSVCLYVASRDSFLL